MELEEYRKKIANLDVNEQKLRDLYLRKLSLGEIQGPNTGFASLDKPWLSYHSVEGINLELPKKTVYQTLLDNNIKYLDSIAINYYGRKISYKELFEKIEITAKALTSYGLKDGDMITLLSVTLPETIYLMYAANKIGVGLNVMDPRTNASKIASSFKETNSKMVFVIEQYVSKIANSLPSIENIVTVSASDSLPFSLKILYNAKTLKEKNIIKQDYPYIKNWQSFEKSGNSMSTIRTVEYQKDKVAFIDYTGGTTGTPKGALLTNDSVNAISEQYKVLDAGIERGQTMLNIMPMFLAYGINMLNMSLNVGVTNILIPVFDPKKFPDLLIKYHPNHFMGVPMHFESLLNNPKLDKQDLSWFITPGVGGDSASAGLEEQINDFLLSHGSLTGLIKGYGMTELSSAAITCTNTINAQGSVGVPLVKNNVKIIDSNTMEELSYNQIGEICIDSPSHMLGYLNNDEETKKTIVTHPDGKKWIHTGDLGYINEDGMVYIINRKKRVIIRPDGHNVFPSAIENVIAKHYAVKDCVVIGVRDSEYENGKWTKALVVLKSEYAGKENIIEQELKQLCLDHLPERDVAYSYDFRDSLPYTPSQKIDILTLETEYEEKQKTLRIRKK